jgi:ComF family protein
LLFRRLLSRAPALPTQCALCRGWAGERLCAECRTRFARPVPRCARCALRVPDGTTVCGACLVAPPPFDTTLAALDYGHPWDRLIGQLKFHAALDLATPFARMLADAWRTAGVPRPDWLLPVPLAPQRLRERGYNQAWEIARTLARELGCRADARLLLRIKDTPHQLAFPVEQRAANVHGAFAVEPARRAELRGRRVALVDDVMTTGATAAALARVLRDAGAAAIDVWVVARTPAPADE